MTLSKFFSGLFLTLLLFVSAADAQIGSWQSFPSLTNAQEIAMDDEGNIWVATRGGLYRYEPGGSIESFTTVDGLYGPVITAMVFEPGAERLWLGFGDGTIQRLDTRRLTFRSFDDIRRSDRFSTKNINRITLVDDELFIATSFGIVIFDPSQEVVRDSYTNLGRFDSGSTVNDLVISNNMIYAATNNGLAAGDLSGPSLNVPDNWDNSDGLGNLGLFENSIRSVTWFDDRIYAATGSQNMQFHNGEWSASTAFSGIISRFRYSRSGENVLGVSTNRITVRYPGFQVDVVILEGDERLTTPFLDDLNGNETLIFGTENDGIGIASTIDGEINFLVPSGPTISNFTDIKKDGDVIIAGSSSRAAVDGITGNTGYHIFRNGNWNTFNRINNETLNEFSFDAAFRTAITDDYFFFGSAGRGLAKHNRSTDEIEIFNVSNSPLLPAQGQSSFTIVAGLESDNQNNVWMTTAYSTQSALYRYSAISGEWETFPVNGAAGSGNTYYNLFIDSSGQKWISLRSQSGEGRGLFVLNKNGSQTQQDAPQGVRLTSNANEGNLPNNQVNAIVQDRRGEVWIGTDRGVARFLFPDRVIDGSSIDRQANFLINADTAAGSPFLLREINATAIAVNAANQKWIGSTDSGIWLVDEPGRRVLRHFTTENSPLLSNSITGISIDDDTGLVYIATDTGLISYVDVTREGETSMNDLFIYPNPYFYKEETGSVFIEGLTDGTTLSIITVDGRMVNRIDTRGGRAEWNVRDFNGRRVASGVYLVVANDSGGNEKGTGKLVIIR